MFLKKGVVSSKKSSLFSLIIVILVSIGLITLISFVITTINSGMKKEKSKLKIELCGDNICEEYEESYCLDCNFKCKTDDYCNSKINIVCEDCSPTKTKLLSKIFENQNIVYDCLSDFFGYNSSLIIYTLDNESQSTCEDDKCYYCGASNNYYGVYLGNTCGYYEFGEEEVIKIKNVGFEIHETTHYFNSRNLGHTLPGWFDEGLAIYTESRIPCAFGITKDKEKIDNIAKADYYKLKNKEKTLKKIAFAKERTKFTTEQGYSNHIIGSMFFIALEEDYNCSNKCVSDILHSLYVYRKNCTGECFSNALNSSSSKIDGINSNDLRVNIITNDVIKQISEKVVNQDLTPLFDLFEVSYTKEFEKV